MRALTRKFLALFFVIYSGLSAAAEKADTSDRPRQSVIQNSPGALTGKERLGKKWMDEQRVDNCRVPVEKRGTKGRPSGCAQGPENRQDRSSANAERK
jgi:hypothetical protein